MNHLHSLRGQFWGRAALAPVILNGSGRFYFVPQIESTFFLKGADLTQRITYCTGR
jgi:hypothetical protein